MSCCRMPRRRRSILHPLFSVLVFAALAALSGCAAAPAHIDPPPNVPPPPPFHLHLPGISGNRWIDRDLVRGLADGGLDAEIQTYDWTTADPGLGSLFAH